MKKPNFPQIMSEVKTRFTFGQLIYAMVIGAFAAIFVALPLGILALAIVIAVCTYVIPYRVWASRVGKFPTWRGFGSRREVE